MKMALKIMRNEWGMLFHTPIAWIVLLVFVLHSGWFFISHLEECLRVKFMGYQTLNLTFTLILGKNGLFPQMINSLFIYIPLLSMSIVVKDYDWGTDKLLFSAPVKIIDILFGKLGALLAFCSLFAGILFIYSTSFVLIAGKPEVAAIGVGLLLFVLVSIFYCCWGLLISSCFSSNVLVLIFTFVGLAFFNYVNHIYLSPLLIDFLNWFALDTKNFPFMTGLFSTDTVIWYLGMSVLFFVYTYLNLYRKCYEVKAKALWGNVGFWSILVVGGICFFQNPRHVYYADTTRARQNSITEKARRYWSELKERCR